MKLSDVIERAINQASFEVPIAIPTLEIVINEPPSYRLRNTCAAFRSELEDIVGSEIQLAGVGNKKGMLCVSFDLATLNEDNIDGLQTFITDQKNASYFFERYGIASMTINPPAAS